MIVSRIANKIRSSIDAVLGSIRNVFEKAGWIKPIPFEVVFSSSEEAYDYPYPLNFNEKDKPLFHSEHSYKTYSTSAEEIFLLKHVELSFQGIVSKGSRTFGPALPHPVFRNKFGWLYLFGQKLFTKKITCDEKCILVYDHWSMANYYHWTMDSLPRIWLAQKNMPDAAVLLPAKIPAFIKDSVALLKLDKVRYIEENERLYIKELYAQNYAAAPGHHHRGVLRELRNFISDRILSADTKGDLVYVSRSRQQKRRIVNEEEVLEVIRKYGFKIIHFEDLSWEEQVKQMKNTKMLLSSHGANLTNMMFMPEKAVIFELIRKDKPNFCYWSLSNCLDFNYYYQLCSLDSADHITVDVVELERNIKKILSS